MVFVDGPDVVGNIELFGNVSKILVVTHNAWNFDIPFTGAITREEIVETVAHFADKNGHTWRFVAKVEVKCHLIAMGIKRLDNVVKLFTRNEKLVELPFDAHEKHVVDVIDVLVKIDDVALVVRNKACNLGNDARRIGAM